ncbi:MAG: ArsB/NhaD family transporter, partial [Candidatus Caldatribacteriota bacterium]|nr:ArsB/NhaD family transporter [Candidatus Caldatribacteriota bacterium]
MNQTIIALIIFITTLIFVSIEKINRTVIVLSGALLFVLLKILNQHEAFLAIDFNTIGLLTGMMVMVSIIKKTGLFQYLAIKISKFAKGNIFRLLFSLSIITGILSSILDNVTTIILIIPITLAICENLEISPVPLILSEIFASNIGGAATLIGDPPNIIIGSAAHLSFMDFIINLAPFILVLLILLPFFIRLFFKKEISQNVSKNWERIERFDEKKAIEDPLLLKKSLISFFITIIVFVFHHNLGLEAATVALSGATLLLLVSGIDPTDSLLEVEWSTLFFFMGLFIIIAGVEKVGIIQWLSTKIINLTKENLPLTALVILWFSGFSCSFINNISYTISMVPIIHNIGAATSFNLNPIWWALSLGACLGGNGTFIAAAANLVGVNILKRQGKIITFRDFSRIGFPIMLISIILSSFYLYL